MRDVYNVLRFVDFVYGQPKSDKKGLTFLVFFERKIHFEKTEFKFIMFHINLWMLTDQKSFSIHVFAFQKNICCE